MQKDKKIFQIESNFQKINSVRIFLLLSTRFWVVGWGWQSGQLHKNLKSGLLKSKIIDLEK